MSSLTLILRRAQERLRDLEADGEAIGPVTDEELVRTLGQELLDALGSADRERLRRWAAARRSPRRKRKRDVPRCGAATHPRTDCPGCGARAKAGKPCPACGQRLPPGPPCQAPPVRDPATGEPANGRCRLHGGMLRGPVTPEGRARANANLRRGTEPGPGERRGGPGGA